MHKIGRTWLKTNLHILLILLDCFRSAGKKKSALSNGTTWFESPLLFPPCNGCCCTVCFLSLHLLSFLRFPSVTDIFSPFPYSLPIILPAWFRSAQFCSVYRPKQTVLCPPIFPSKYILWWILCLTRAECIAC